MASQENTTLMGQEICGDNNEENFSISKMLSGIEAKNIYDVFEVRRWYFFEPHRHNRHIGFHIVFIPQAIEKTGY
jgi:hypothetical protein